MACIGMAYMSTADMVTAYIGMASIGMAYIVMAQQAKLTRHRWAHGAKADAWMCAWARACTRACIGRSACAYAPYVHVDAARLDWPASRGPGRGYPS